MKYFIIAIAIAFGLGLASSAYAAEEGGGQGGMQPKGSLTNPEGNSPSPSSSETGSISNKKSGESSLGMQKEQTEKQKDSPSIPSTTGTTEGRGDRFGESGSGQGSGGGAGSAPGLGNR